MAQGSSLKHSPIRVGFVVDWIDEYYQTTVLAGAAHVAREKEIELVVLPGGVIGAEHDHGASRNGLYRLISVERYDALVVMTGTLGNAHGVDVSRDICQNFPADRICHVAIDVPGSASVLIDNKVGVRKAVEHLIRVHGKTKIGFVRGPRHNQEAEDRYHAFEDAMELRKISVDPRLVVDGDFTREAGIEAVRELLDVRRVTLQDIEALVVASDSMAVTLLDELRRRGIRVPTQIAVIGFDDIEEARFTVPPLSSVWQPLFEQGQEAMNAVVESIDNSQQRRPHVLPTVCHFRRSCGCTSEDLGFLTERPKSDTRLSLEASVVRRKEQILDEVQRAAPRELEDHEPDWKRIFFDAVLAGVRDRPEDFRDQMDVLFESVIASGGDASATMMMISALRRQLSVCAGDHPGQLRQVEGLLHDARILASDAIERAQAYRRTAVERLTRIIADMSTCLMLTRTESEFAMKLPQELPRAGLSTALICLYTDSRREQVRVMAGSWQGRPVEDEIRASRYAAIDLIPPALNRAGSCWVIEPLDGSEGLVGFAVFKWAEAPGYLYEILRTTFSRAVAGLQMQ